MKVINGVSFLSIGKTQESTDAQEFKRYVGVASSNVLAVNPTKEKLDELRGFESQNEPEYIKDGENGKEAHINFIVKTVPDANNGIEIVNTLMFTLRATPDYNKDQTKVRVIDGYGNSTWANTEDAKAGKKLLSQEGNELKIDSAYRMACVGEADLVSFLKKYLGVPDAFDYVNGSWVKGPKAEDGKFALEHIKDYFKGDFSELREAIALQPNNKIKLLYGVRTTDDNKQYQVIASRDRLILPNYAGSKSLTKLETELANIKANGGYPTTEFKVQELQEYTVNATDVNALGETSTTENDEVMPW